MPRSVVTARDALSRSNFPSARSAPRAPILRAIRVDEGQDETIPADYFADSGYPRVIKDLKVLPEESPQA